MASCSLCEVNVAGGARSQCIHVAGQDHKKRDPWRSQYPARQVNAVTRNNQAIAPSHAGVTHARNHNQQPHNQQFYTQYESTLEEVTKKKGLTIEGTFDFGFVDPSFPLPKYDATIKTTDRNSTPPSTSRLLEIKLASSQGNLRRSSMYVLYTSLRSMALIFSLSFSIEISGIQRTILPKQPIRFLLALRHAYRGRYEDRADFIFEDVHLGQRFMVSQTLRVIIANRAEHDTYRPLVPYAPRARIDRRPMNEIVPGEKPPAVMAITYVGRLPQADIPTELHKALARFRSTSEAVAQIKKTFLPALFDCRTYALSFKYLLWIEEYRME